jgi:hypothetical protein
MYLRSTRRKNADGSTVEYLQLAENVWDSDKGCAVAKVVYNFGRADKVRAIASKVGSFRQFEGDRSGQTFCSTRTKP